jgi:hypothetical protein
MNKSNYGPGTKALLDPTNAFWNLAMTFKTSGLFLLNTLWQFLLSKVRLSPLYSPPLFDCQLSTIRRCLHHLITRFQPSFFFFSSEIEDFIPLRPG